MSDPLTGATQGEEVSEAGDELRQALMRLISPQVEELQGEISRLQRQIEALRQLEQGDANQLQKKLKETESTLGEIEARFQQLSAELRDPVMIGQRLDKSMVAVLHGQTRRRSDEVAEALAPAIGPAIRHQIREAKDDIINALYPLIGPIIGKALAESMRELTRSIDSRLRQQFSFRERVNARLRGVSEAELLLRGSLPYSIERVFLIHRETGILLSHLSTVTDNGNPMDTVSGMLTAIQDFVRDSFSGGEGELEEITHGGLRILLEGGQHAYVAVVLSGTEPAGYNRLIWDVVHQINLDYEPVLRKFDGDMARLPDFQPILGRLVSHQTSAEAAPVSNQPLTASQKRIVGFALVGFLILIGLLIFGCIFTARLLPVAFPPATSTPTLTATPLPSLTPTAIPTFTPTVVATFTATFIPSPTATNTVPPPSPTALPIGIVTGNLNVRAEPAFDAPVKGVILAGEKVTVKEKRGDWYLIVWSPEGKPPLEGWVNGAQFLQLPAGFTP